MEAKKKSNKGLIIALVIIIFLLVGCLGYGVYKYLSLDKDYDNLNTKYENVNSKLNDVNKSLEKSKKDLEDVNKDLNDTKTVFNNSNHRYITNSYYNVSYNIYSIGMDMVIGYNGELYSMEGDWNQFNVPECVSQIAKGVRFKDSTYTCNVETSDDMKLVARKLNIKEENVYKVVLQKAVGTTDAQYDCFVIDKNGGVTWLLFGRADSHNESKRVFNDYKVDDIREICTKKVGYNCHGVGYKLTLQDGSTKTLSKLS